MAEQEFQNPISVLRHYHKSGAAADEEDRMATLTLADEAMKFGDYKRAEQILRDGLYEVEFRSYLRSLKIYTAAREISKIDPQIREIVEETGFFQKYLEGIIGKQEALCNFDQEISPLILRIKSEGEKK